MRHPDLPQLAAADLDKLAAILALLSSDKPGEVVAAAAAAQRLLSRHGLTFRDIVAQPALPAIAETTGTFDVFLDWPTRWRAAVYLCQQVPQTWLTPFERQFVANLAKYKHKPSEAQLDILATVASNVIAKGGASR
jgi:hypothetical protein